MSKIIMICITAIICVCILAAPKYLADVFKVTEEVEPTLYIYDGIKVLSTSENGTLLLDTRNGILYNIYTSYGDIDEIAVDSLSDKTKSDKDNMTFSEWSKKYASD